ncbi:hypothetical protein BDW02DRAFT_333208 [Decorospora gaudefroyi]|uniref:Uncharacterized protein n=1 Tax=Decorospora gaudefroyi TaxID=184978 RepID=A0A6A5KE85_9PLEO|nr:hypothetical protein BDW02DRAFT_333208 [Decorospora gaudefroyi]
MKAFPVDLNKDADLEAFNPYLETAERNLNTKSWTRMMYVLPKSEPVNVNGEVLKEDHGPWRVFQ